MRTALNSGQSILHSTVRSELESAGYKTVAFASGFAFTEMTTADVYLSPSPVWSAMTEFETLLIRTTPASPSGGSGPDRSRPDRWTTLPGSHPAGILSSMDKLAHMPGPKFVFIHLLPPHPLFIFGPDGSPTNPAPFMDANGIYSSRELLPAAIATRSNTFPSQLEKAAATCWLSRRSRR